MKIDRNLGSSLVSAGGSIAGGLVSAVFNSKANSDNISFQREVNRQSRYDAQHDLDYRVSALKRNGYSLSDPSLAGYSNPETSAPTVEPLTDGNALSSAGTALGSGLLNAGMIDLQKQSLEQQVEAQRLKNQEQNLNNLWQERLLNQRFRTGEQNLINMNTQNDWYQSQSGLNGALQKESETRVAQSVMLFPVKMRSSLADIEQTIANTRLSEANRKLALATVNKLRSETALIGKELQYFDVNQKVQYAKMMQELTNLVKDGSIKDYTAKEKRINSITEQYKGVLDTRFGSSVIDNVRNFFITLSGGDLKSVRADAIDALLSDSDFGLY